jgi:hypothetical protein
MGGLGPPESPEGSAVKWGVAVTLAAVLAVHAVEASGQPVDVAARAAEAGKVVVGTVFSVQGRFAENEFGDRLIVSDVLVRVDEELRSNVPQTGQFSSFLALKVEGGTVGNLRLEVSDMPALGPGERAVFFLDQETAGVYELHRRDLGVLKLDTGGNVLGNTLTLDDVRREVRRVR